MSYYREVRKDELVAWLVNVAREEQSDAEELAELLLARFDILSESKTPS